MSLGINNSSFYTSLGADAVSGLYKKQQTKKTDETTKTDSAKSTSTESDSSKISSKYDRYIKSADGDTATTGISQTNEKNLSKKAQDLLSKLREQYKDFDLYVGNTTEEQEKLSNAGTKDISVIFSADELEKMANDEEYANQVTDKIDSAVGLLKKATDKYGLENTPESEHGQITKLGITLNDDGTVSLFADLQKASLKESERIKAQAADKKAAAKKAEKDKAEKDAADKDGKVTDKSTGKDVSKSDEAEEADTDYEYPEYRYDPATVKFTTVTASNVEDLIKAIKGVKWDDISPALAGDRVDFTA